MGHFDIFLVSGTLLPYVKMHAMFIFAAYFVHVTKKITVRTLHIRAKPPAVSLLAAMSAFVVWTSTISMRTVAKVPA